MLGHGYLHIYDFGLLFKGLGTLTLGKDVQSASVTFSGTGLLYCAGETNAGAGWFPALAGVGYETVDPGLGRGGGYLPPLVGAGEGGVYTPPVTQLGFGLFPALVAGGTMTTSSPGEGDARFPALLGIGGEGDYGFGGGYFPPMFVAGLDDFMPGVAPVMTSVYAFTGAVGAMDHIIFVDNRGQVTGSITGTREAVEQFMTILEASGAVNVLGDFLASAVVDIDASGALAGQVVKSIAGVPTVMPGVDPDARVWVVNTDTGASVQYDDYGFNSFFERDGEYFGVAEDGIYKLSGATDAGVPINALIDFGRSTFGTAQRKRLLNFYAAVISPQRMILRVEADGQTYTYDARSSSNTALKHHRFDLGRGLAGTHWRIEVLNRAGCDFDIESLEFEPVVLSRKI